MTEPIFDHDRLDVYRLSIDYVAQSFAIAKELNGLHRPARDQWLRAAQSIPLNIAEGNGKRSLKDRNRFLDITRGSALECASIQDVLAATDGHGDKQHGELKRTLKRIVSMLTRLIPALTLSPNPARNTMLLTSTSTAMLSTSTKNKNCTEGRGAVVLQINVHRASSVNSTVLALNESYSYSDAAGTRTRLGTDAEPIFDHDRLDVYRLSIDYVAQSFAIAKHLNGLHRHARDQWLRACCACSPNRTGPGTDRRLVVDVSVRSLAALT